MTILINKRLDWNRKIFEVLLVCQLILCESMEQSSRLLKRNGQIVMREIAGETILVPIHQTGVDLQHVYILNKTATTIWQLLEKKRTLSELIAAVQALYEENLDTISNDVISLVDDFIVENFVSYIEV